MGGTCAPGPRVVVAQMPPLLRAILKYRDLKGDADLRCRETNAGGQLHGRPHLGDEMPQLRSVQRGGFDRIGNTAQDRVTALNDREHVLIARERNWVSHVSRSPSRSGHSWCVEAAPGRTRGNGGNHLLQ